MRLLQNLFGKKEKTEEPEVEVGDLVDVEGIFYVNQSSHEIKRVYTKLCALTNGSSSLFTDMVGDIFERSPEEGESLLNAFNDGSFDYVPYKGNGIGLRRIRDGRKKILDSRGDQPPFSIEDYSFPEKYRVRICDCNLLRKLEKRETPESEK